jgi:hypothetical protein
MGGCSGPRRTCTVQVSDCLSQLVQHDMFAPVLVVAVTGGGDCSVAMQHHCFSRPNITPMQWRCHKGAAYCGSGSMECKGTPLLRADIRSRRKPASCFSKSRKCSQRTAEEIGVASG